MRLIQTVKTSFKITPIWYIYEMDRYAQIALKKGYLVVQNPFSNWALEHYSDIELATGSDIHMGMFQGTFRNIRDAKCFIQRVSVTNETTKNYNWIMDIDKI